MIISASRRTDIPAFYSPWLINRIQAGYCTVPNPFNRKQVSYVSLLPEDVDAIVFWTRNAATLIPHLDELDERQIPYYFQYTLLDNPKVLDPKSPSLKAALKTFHQLAERIGPERVIWRYDPIVLSDVTDVDFHIDAYRRISDALQGATKRSVVSIVDYYKKASRRWRDVQNQGVEVKFPDFQQATEMDKLMNAIVETAHEHDMEIFSCSETINLKPYGILPGKCIDDDYIKRVFGIDVTHKKDPNQRKECGCVVSKDIGMYDTCLFGCQYCYATTSFERAKINHAAHDSQSPSLVGWYEAEKPTPKDKKPSQKRLL